ncbi:hypothetical protein BH24ACT2_BH24ACT2_01000 [soil metagenome]
MAAVRAHAERRGAEAAPYGAGTAPVTLADRRRRREMLTGAVAAAIGVALGAVGSEVLNDDPPPGAPTQPVELAVASPDVEAEAVTIDHTWGVEVILTATGLAPGAVYRVAVQPADGSADVSAGSFLGVDGVRVVCRMNASVLRAAATSFTVFDEQGATVIAGRFV